MVVIEYLGYMAAFDGDVWHSDDERLQSRLMDRLRHVDRGPSRGDPEVAVAEDAVAYLGDRAKIVAISERAADDPNTIY